MSKIYKQIIITVFVIYTCLYSLYLLNYITIEFLTASIYSGLLNLANAFTAIAIFNVAVKKNNKGFLIFNFGGMTVRLLLLLISIFIFFKLTDIDKYGFIILFFVFYFVFLIYEINHFVLKAPGKK